MIVAARVRGWNEAMQERWFWVHFWVWTQKPDFYAPCHILPVAYWWLQGVQTFKEDGKTIFDSDLEPGYILSITFSSAIQAKRNAQQNLKPKNLFCGPALQNMKSRASALPTARAAALMESVQPNEYSPIELVATPVTGETQYPWKD